MSLVVKCSNPSCGKEFKTYPSRIAEGGGKYCGRRCFERAQSVPHIGKTDVIERFFADYPFATVKDCATVTGQSLEKCQKVRRRVMSEAREIYKREWDAKWRV